jgi:hypothetical protein
MNVSSMVAIPWVLPIVCGSIVAIVSILDCVIRDCVISVAQTNLKRSMVEQGYTVEQIDQVLMSDKAAGKPTKPSRMKS